MSLVKVIENSNVTEWLNASSVKLTLEQVCEKFGIDIENDPINRIFWNVNLTRQILINDDMLNYMGYTGTFCHRNQYFRKLLKKNASIEYTNVTDEKDHRKKYVLLSGIDFESLLMQMRTAKSAELRTIFSVMKMTMTKYCEYEKIYADRLAETSARQTDIVMNKLEQVGAKFETEMKTAADEWKALIDQAHMKLQREMEKAAVERRDIERRALLEMEKAAAERHQISQQLKRNVRILESKIVATRFTPPPPPQSISVNKIRILGIYRTSMADEWYMMQRQREGWNDAERKLLKRDMVLLHRWDNLSHAVDVGNLIKKHFRRHLSWDARSNRIKTNPNSPATITDNFVLRAIQSIITKENCARENKNLINS